MRATAFNQQVAQSLGISVKSVFAMAWAISATSRPWCVPAGQRRLGRAFRLWRQVFPAAILGGLDSVPAARCSAASSSGSWKTSRTFSTANICTGAIFYEIAPFYALIIILMIKPYGLFGTKDIERCNIMAGQTLIPAGDFRTSYAADTTVFPTTTSRNAMIAASS